MNSNANNRIPFDPNPDLFRKRRNNIIKKTSSNKLKEIIFFGEIVIDENKYYRYACYNNKGKIQYLELKQTVSNAHSLQYKWERGENSLLPFSSSRKNTRQPHARQNIVVNKTRPIQNFSGNPVLVVQKIPHQSVNHQDFMNLLENLNNSLNISKFLKNNGSSFRPDPNEIELSELEKKPRNFSFKIIHKIKLLSLKFNDPIILFGEINGGININRKFYYQYCCYKSSGIGSENGVTFRKLSNNSNDLKKFRNKTNINNENVDKLINRTYLYYIKISDIPNNLLRKLSQIIEFERFTKKNQSLYKTIYNQVSLFLHQNNVQTKEEGIQLQNMGPNRVNKRIAFNGNPNAFMKKESDPYIKFHIKFHFSVNINLIIFFGEIEIGEQKYYKYACYVIDGVIYFITLQQPNNKQTKLKVVKIDRKHVEYDLQNLFKELNSSSYSKNLSKNKFNMYKTSISEMCRLLDISRSNFCSK